MNSSIISLVCDNDEDRLLISRIVNVRSSFIENIRSSLLQFRFEEATWMNEDEVIWTGSYTEDSIDSDEDTEVTIENEDDITKNEDGDIIEDGYIVKHGLLRDHRLHSPLLKMIKRQWCQLTLSDINIIRELWNNDTLYITIKGYLDKRINNEMPYTTIALMMSMHNNILEIHVNGYDNYTIELSIMSRDIIYVTFLHPIMYDDNYHHEEFYYGKTKHGYVVKETHSSHWYINDDVYTKWISTASTIKHLNKWAQRNKIALKLY